MSEASGQPAATLRAMNVRVRLFAALRERAGTGFGGVRLRKCIVTLQVAFSLILVIAAGLFVRTLAGLLAKGPGFETSGILSPPRVGRAIQWLLNKTVRRGNHVKGLAKTYQTVRQKAVPASVAAR